MLLQGLQRAARQGCGLESQLEIRGSWKAVAAGKDKTRTVCCPFVDASSELDKRLGSL